MQHDGGDLCTPPFPEGEVVIATASDENYAIGMAVTVRSAIEHLHPSRALRVYALDGGISEATRERVLQSWRHPRVTVEWLRPEMKALEDLITVGHLNHCTYLRLLMPHILPQSLQKVIYLDADLLVRRDVSQLWDQPLDDRPALAAVEVAAPFVDCATAIGEWERYQFVAERNPVKNFRQLGIPGERKFFNAGVLVVNLDRWRRECIPQQAMICLKQHREFVLWCDEYALNVVMSGRWGELDARWNQGAAFYSYPCWQESPFDKTTFHQIKHDPWVIHFTWIKKPWLPGCRHPFQNEYLACLDKTDWRGHRPDPVGPLALAAGSKCGPAHLTAATEGFREWWRTAKDQSRPFRRGVVRNIKNFFRTNRRDAA